MYIVLVSLVIVRDDYVYCALHYVYFHPCATPTLPRLGPSISGSTAIVGLGLLYEVSRSHSVGHTTIGRTPLDEWSARRRDLYLRTHNTHKRQTDMPLAGFESAIPASERPLTHVLHCAATEISYVLTCSSQLTRLYQSLWRVSLLKNRSHYKILQNSKKYLWCT
jgi:hypothetical protein